MTERVVLEFTVEPFVPTDPGPHVLASIDAARLSAGDDVDVGPFGTTVSGSADDISDTTRAVVAAALAHGATRVSLQIRTETSNGRPDSD